MFISEGLVEQHIHGCFGIDFMTCSGDEINEAARNLAKCGVSAFFPTVMTDEIGKIKERISVIKSAMLNQNEKSAKICGIHLEGPFINPKKKGIHQSEYIQQLDIAVFKEIEDEIIKIVTLAPELDEGGKFIRYLKSRGIKVSAGHCLGDDLREVEQVTHLYNAMGSFHHRDKSTVVSALINDEIYTEIIGDSEHVCDDVLRLTFKQKPKDKILLISDALALAHSDKNEQIFAGECIYKREGKLVSKEGTLGGSAMLLCDIVKNLTEKGIMTFKEAINCASSNQLRYHGIENNLKVYWNKFYEIEDVEFIWKDQR